MATPASWLDVDLDPTTRAESIARLAAERADGDGRADELARLLEEAAADAASREAIYAAVYSDVLAGRPVTASLVVSILAVGPGATPPGDLSPAVVVEGIRRVLSRAGTDQTVEILDLPQGPAVRRRRRTLALAPGRDGPSPVESVQYFVPAPVGVEVAALAFATPTVDLSELLVDLFDAIAGTLTWI